MKRHFWLSSLGLICFIIIPALAQIEKTDKSDINYETRLAFYLDQRSRDFLEDMVNKETLLLDLIKNITSELKIRGKSALANDELGYHEIYAQSETLIKEYSAELEKVVKIIREIDFLKQVTGNSRDLTVWENLVALRERMMQLLENREIYQNVPYNPRRVAQMFQDYYSEVDSLVSLYDRLEKLAQMAEAQGDVNFLQQIVSQKNRIQRLIGNHEGYAVNYVADEFVEETQQIVNILNEVEQLETTAISSNSDISVDLEKLRRDLLKRVDKRFLKLMGYDVRSGASGLTVSEIFKQWKARQIADYKARFTKYKIMKKRLLANSTPLEKNRMLARDLHSAFSSYMNGKYSLAESQFNVILEDYGDFFTDLDAIYFYRGESYYARRLLNKAVSDYEKVVSNYHDSSFMGEALFRLMLIYEKSGNLRKFYACYDQFKNQANRISRPYRDRFNYLAGYVYLKNDNWNQAEEVLQQVSEDSRYYNLAQYLLGIVYANQGKLDQARPVFERLASQTNDSRTDVLLNFIRNNALLKLGYISYQQGDYKKALEYFNRVSPGFTGYDRSLLASAWTYFKEGEFDKTIEKVNQLFHDYRASDYTYEALVLAAHCKRLLNQQDEALKDLRYVANARKVLSLSQQYNEERKLVLQRLAEVQQLEEQILDYQDRALYRIAASIRNKLQDLLQQFQSKGVAGTLLLDEFQDERQAIFRQIEELDQIIAKAETAGDQTAARRAYKQRERLIEALDNYQADKSIRNINYFIDYPLATKESFIKYRKNILSEISQEMDLENKKLTHYLNQVQSLQEIAAYSPDLDAKLDLEILEEDLTQLQNNTSQLDAWVAENQVENIQTDFDRWADFSGFGMSDITFQTIQEKNKQLSDYASKIGLINKILIHKKEELEKKIAEYDEQVRKIEEKLHKEKIEQEKKEREKYFKEHYFETEEKENSGL